MAETSTENQAILSQLQSVPQYYGTSADLFASIGLEPGDIIVIKQGEESQSVPVFEMNLEWNGDVKAEVQATGSEKRPPLSALKRNNYASGKRAAEQEERLDGYYTEYTDSKYDIGMVAGALGVVLDGGRPQYDGDGKLVYNPDSAAEIFTKLSLRANEGALFSAIYDAGGHTVAFGGTTYYPGDVLIRAINHQDGASGTVTIDADKVKINGNTTISSIFGVNSSGYLTVAGDIYQNGVIHPTGVSVAQGGSIDFLVGTSPPVPVSLTGSDLQNLLASVADAQIVPVTGTNDYKLQIKYIGDTTWTDAGTFNGAAAGWADAAAAVTWPAAGTGTSFGVTVPDTSINTTTSKTFSLNYSGGYMYVNDGTNDVARRRPSGLITANSAQSDQPSGTRLREVTVGTSGSVAYVRVTASGYRSNNDYIQINY